MEPVPERGAGRDRTRSRTPLPEGLTARPGGSDHASAGRRRLHSPVRPLGPGRIRMRRPRIKPEHAAYRTADGRIRIGGGVFGIAAEIADPCGWLWSLVRAVDGTAGPAEIIDRVRLTHPEAAEADVLEALEGLIGAGYVEDAAAGVPADFSRREQQRYSRSVRYFRWVDLRPREQPVGRPAHPAQRQGCGGRPRRHRGVGGAGTRLRRGRVPALHRSRCGRAI